MSVAFLRDRVRPDENDIGVDQGPKCNIDFMKRSHKKTQTIGVHPSSIFIPPIIVALILKYLSINIDLEQKAYSFNVYLFKI